MSIEKEITNALKQDINLSREEYAEKAKKADTSTKAHGVKGKAAVVSEELRHKRVQTNFYATMLNVICGLIAELQEIKTDMQEIKEEIKSSRG